MSREEQVRKAFPNAGPFQFLQIMEIVRWADDHPKEAVSPCQFPQLPKGYEVRIVSGARMVGDGAMLHDFLVKRQREIAKDELKRVAYTKICDETDLDFEIINEGKPDEMIRVQAFILAKKKEEQQ